MVVVAGHGESLWIPSPRRKKRAGHGQGMRRVDESSLRERSRSSRESTGAAAGGWLMHCRSSMTVFPRIPTMPGRRTSGFQRRGRRRVHHARKRRELFGESHEDLAASC